jgi:hypothetical protein
VRIALSGRGIDSDVALFRVTVNDEGQWTYQSRAIEHIQGSLSEADQAQIRSLYKAVDWDHQKLNATIRYKDRVEFCMEVDHGDGNIKSYFFSEVLRPNDASWEFRDLVHFLRHNVIGPTEPVWPEQVPTERPEARP